MRLCRHLITSMLAAALLSATSNLAAGDSKKMEGPAPTYSYSRLYMDADGVSHFDDHQLQLSIENYSPPANPTAVHALQNVDTATFVLLPVGAFEDWHPAPRRQYAVIMKGVVEVTAGDGEKRQFGPGTMVLLEDTAGKGHQTRVISDEESLTVMVAVESESASDE